MEVREETEKTKNINFSPSGHSVSSVVNKQRTEAI